MSAMMGDTFDPIMASLTVAEEKQVPIHVKTMYVTLTPLSVVLRAFNSDFTVTLYFEDIRAVKCIPELGQIIAVTGSLHTVEVSVNGVRREYIIIVKDPALARQLADVIGFKAEEHRLWREQRRTKQLIGGTPASSGEGSGRRRRPVEYRTVQRQTSDGLLASPRNFTAESETITADPHSRGALASYRPTDSVHHPRPQSVSINEDSAEQYSSVTVRPDSSQRNSKYNDIQTSSAAVERSTKSAPRPPSWLLSRNVNEMQRHDSILHNAHVSEAEPVAPPGYSYVAAALQQGTAAGAHDGNTKAAPTRDDGAPIMSPPPRGAPASVFVFDSPPPFMFESGAFHTIFETPPPSPSDEPLRPEASATPRARSTAFRTATARPLPPMRRQTTAEPPPGRRQTTAEPTPVRQQTTMEPPTRQQTTAEPTPVRQQTTAEPTPVRQQTTMEPPTPQQTTAEPTPVRQQTTSEPTLVSKPAVVGTARIPPSGVSSSGVRRIPSSRPRAVSRAASSSPIRRLSDSGARSSELMSPLPFTPTAERPRPPPPPGYGTRVP